MEGKKVFGKYSFYGVLYLAASACTDILCVASRHEAQAQAFPKDREGHLGWAGWTATMIRRRQLGWKDRCRRVWQLLSRLLEARGNATEAGGDATEAGGGCVGCLV